MIHRLSARMIALQNIFRICDFSWPRRLQLSRVRRRVNIICKSEDTHRCKRASFMHEVSRNKTGKLQRIIYVCMLQRSIFQSLLRWSLVFKIQYFAKGKDI